MKKYCTKCGNPLNEGDRFCPKCGTECKEDRTNSSILSVQMKPHTIWERFISLPIWLKLSYVFAFWGIAFMFIYTLTYSHHYDYYFSKNELYGFVTCYDDLRLVEMDRIVMYYDVEDIGHKIEDAMDEAKMSLDGYFESFTIATILLASCFIIINVFLIKYIRKIKLDKYKIYIFIFISNIFFPVYLFLYSLKPFYELSRTEKVTRSFLSDIPAIKEYAYNHGISIDGHFRDIEQLNDVGTQNNQSSNTSSSNNSGTQDDGSFVYYEDAQEMPHSSSNSYYEDNTTSDRQSEYKEPCGLCGGDGKCYNARARSLAEMEMYCNGTGSCPKCYGKTYVNNSYEGIDSPMKCTYCNGTGICPKCNGTRECNACHGRRL